MRRFPAPWSIEEEKECFTIVDANGIVLAWVGHRQHLHSEGYDLAYKFLSRDEARRIAKGISRLPELLQPAAKLPDEA